LIGLLAGKRRGFEEICLVLMISSELAAHIIAYMGLVSPHGRPMRIYKASRYWTPEQKQLLLKLWATDLSIEEIAALIKRGRASVVLKARSFGLYMRERAALQRMARESGEYAPFGNVDENAVDARGVDVTVIEPIDLIVSDPPCEEFSELAEEAIDSGPLAATDEVTAAVGATDVATMDFATMDVAAVEEPAVVDFVSPADQACQDPTETVEEPRHIRGNDEEAADACPAGAVAGDSVDPCSISPRYESARDEANVANVSEASDPRSITTPASLVTNLPWLFPSEEAENGGKPSKTNRKGRRKQQSEESRPKKAENAKRKRRKWTDEMRALAFKYFDWGLTSLAASILMDLSEGAVRSYWSKVGLEGRQGCDIWKGEGPSPIRHAARHLVEREDDHTKTMFWCRKEDKPWNRYSPATRRSKWAREHDIARKFRRRPLP
jgi:hypothetical protein